MKHKAIVYRDSMKEWRYQIVASNGKIIADCGEGYKRRGRCVQALYKLLALNQEDVIIRIIEIGPNPNHGDYVT